MKKYENNNFQGFSSNSNKKYNYIAMPDFNTKPKSNFNTQINTLNKSQNITNKEANPLTLSINDKIKEMKAQLMNDNFRENNDNNDFKRRIEKISKCNYGAKNSNKNEIKNSEINSLKNKIKRYEDQRENEKKSHKDAFNELDDIFNNFQNNRYNNSTKENK